MPWVFLQGPLRLARIDFHYLCVPFILPKEDDDDDDGDGNSFRASCPPKGQALD